MHDRHGALRAVSADGHDVDWETWDGAHGEHLALRWDNEAWTATVDVGGERVQYVMRVSPARRVRQFLLFRDVDQPDVLMAELNGLARSEDFARSACLAAPGGAGPSALRST